MNADRRFVTLRSVLATVSLLVCALMTPCLVVLLVWMLIAGLWELGSPSHWWVIRRLVMMSGVLWIFSLMMVATINFSGTWLAGTWLDVPMPADLHHAQDDTLPQPYTYTITPVLQAENPFERPYDASQRHLDLRP